MVDSPPFLEAKVEFVLETDKFFFKPDFSPFLNLEVKEYISEKSLIYEKVT
jgi:hypothetical protein